MLTSDIEKKQLIKHANLEPILKNDNQCFQQPDLLRLSWNVNAIQTQAEF